MSGAPWRVAKVLAVYTLFVLLALAALPTIRETFLLPELFDVAARWGLGAGGVLAVVVAWRYPHVGGDGGSDGGGGRA